jgi:hypothetical protein
MKRVRTNVDNAESQHVLLVGMMPGPFSAGSAQTIRWRPETLVLPEQEQVYIGVVG